MRHIAYYAGAYGANKTVEAVSHLRQWVEENGNPAIVFHSAQHLGANHWRIVDAKQKLRSRVFSIYQLAQHILGDREYRPFVPYHERAQTLMETVRTWPLPELYTIIRQQRIDTALLYTALLLPEKTREERDDFPHRRLARAILSMYGAKTIREIIDTLNRTWEQEGRRDPNRTIFRAISRLQNGSAPFDSYLFDDADGLDVGGVELMLALIAHPDTRRLYIYSDPIRERLAGGATGALPDSLRAYLQTEGGPSTFFWETSTGDESILYENLSLRFSGAYLLGEFDQDRNLRERFILLGAFPRSTLSLNQKRSEHALRYNAHAFSKALRLLRPLDEREEMDALRSVLDTSLGDKKMRVALVAANAEHFYELAGRYADYDPIPLSHFKDDLLECVLAVLDVAHDGPSKGALEKIIRPVAAEFADQIARADDAELERIWHSDATVIEEVRRLVEKAKSALSKNTFPEAVIEIARLGEMQQWVSRFGRHAESRAFHADLKQLIQHFIQYQDIYSFGLDDFFRRGYGEPFRMTFGYTLLASEKLYLLLAKDLRYYRFDIVLLPSLSDQRWNMTKGKYWALYVAYNALAAAEQGVHFSAPHYLNGKQAPMPRILESIIHHGRDYRLGL